MADRPVDAGFQDDRRLSSRQRTGDPRCLCSVCRNLNLFTRAVVALDGSRFKAVNNRDKNFTVAKVAKRIEQVEASIARYLAALDRADRQDDDVAEAKTVRLKEKIEGLRRQMQSLKEMDREVEAAPDKQVSLCISARCPIGGTGFASRLSAAWSLAMGRALRFLGLRKCFIQPG